MVVQAIAMVTMTSNFVQKPWPSDFDPLFVPLCHCFNTVICGEFDAKSCDSVETVAQRGIGGQNLLAMVFGQNSTSLLP